MDESSAQTSPSDVNPSGGSTGARPISGIRFPAYDLADRRFRHKAFESERRADEFFSQIKIVESDHAGPIRSVGGANPFDSPQKLHGAQPTNAFQIAPPRLVGYAHVSNDEQTTRLQRDALRAAGVDVVFEDKESGARRSRPQLERALAALRPGDTLVV